jgi:catechol 2,3-dioxygenase-like lactoylglutathione lyase family enzyme
MIAAQLRVTGINHVVLHVTDLPRSKSFYTDLLGFEDRNICDVPPGMRASFLLCGVQGLDIFEVPEDAHGGEEMNHLALNVAVGDVDQLVALLTEAGIEATRAINQTVATPWPWLSMCPDGLSRSHRRGRRPGCGLGLGACRGRGRRAS